MVEIHWIVILIFGAVMFWAGGENAKADIND